MVFQNPEQELLSYKIQKVLASERISPEIYLRDSIDGY
jgi:hypothetical protein